MLHPPSHPGRRSLDTMEAEGAISKVSGSHSSRADSIFHGFPSKSEQECSCLMRHFTRPNIFWQLPTCRDGKNCGSHVGHVILTTSELYESCVSSTRLLYSTHPRYFFILPLRRRVVPVLRRGRLRPAEEGRANEAIVRVMILLQQCRLPQNQMK